MGNIIKEIEGYDYGLVALDELRLNETGSIFSIFISNTKILFGGCDERRQSWFCGT